MQSGSKVLIVGAGLAGVEASYYLAQRNISVVLCEAKSVVKTPAQTLETFAELVCTNSLKSVDPASPHGLLKREMRRIGSLVLELAQKHRVPAGDALAVNRVDFSNAITQILSNHPNIQVVHEEVTDPLAFAQKYGCDNIIISSGPLTSPALEKWILDNIVSDKSDFYFYDAIAPIVDADTLDMSKLYFKDRHHELDEETQSDYLNAPMNKEQYEIFITELLKAEKTPSRNFEEYRFFESCLPIDLMAERGVDTARFSCMKPIGLELPDGTLPYACVQLRKENLRGSAYNLVGFQTRLKFGEQKRVFRLIPGLEEAEFLHYGSVHRNSYLNSKEICNPDFSTKKIPNLYFAGQITGVEGYTESAMSGLFVAFNLCRKLQGLNSVSFPIETGIGALVNYIMTAPKAIPSNLNYGLFPELEDEGQLRKIRIYKKKLKKELLSMRAERVFETFIKDKLC